ncbi:peptidoglycan bridge formation glycyltransferase FemA/FemB family protein [Devosia sp. BSSL-BM10]|uniref:Peptidoglycan bridge formation glycyltransferase FemA/FemB family protein n=1 Tax=Devosia litorisediminis TaxID=2829817 RepID=A0A942E8L7_9HYPH|nr:peptidoglycan bridge formation glycyltransferase FemA/FemB family protein [Devosia litorisediminis]MBS3847859.1 peptidoglycan bridge formation glycyltransferase FemA/FemB family protein [Devosia litorisediminis]
MSVIADRLSHSQADAPETARVASAALVLETKLISGQEWDQAIADFDEVCQEQLYAFAVARWPSVEHEPVLFLLNGEVVGGSLMMVQPLPLRLGHIAVSKWGPMLKDLSRPDADAIHAGMIEALVADYADKRGQMISVLACASTTPVNGAYQRLEARGFKSGSQLLYPSRYIVNLRLDDATQRKSLNQKWRYHLNKSEKAGLTFEWAGPERLAEFDALYTAMTDRKQFSDHSAYDSVASLMELDEALRPELFFVRHEGVVVAGALIFKAGDRAVYLYGATNDQALPLRAGYFMHWHIIRWLRDNTRARWYDLGGTDGFQGLHQFKKGMVGDAGVIEPVPPVANYASNPLAYLLGTGAFAARDAIYQIRRVVDGWRNPKTKPTQVRADRNEAAQ